MYSQKQLPDSSWNLFIVWQSPVKMSDKRPRISIEKINLIEKSEYDFPDKNLLHSIMLDIVFVSHMMNCSGLKSPVCQLHGSILDCKCEVYVVHLIPTLNLANHGAKLFFPLIVDHMFFQSSDI